MTALTTAATRLKRRRSIPNTCSAHLRSTGDEQHVVINQPLEQVLARMRVDAQFGTGDRSSSDPTFHHVSTQGRHPIDVEYTCYAIPGGTQITSIIHMPRSGVFHLRDFAAGRAAQQHAALSLCRLKELLE